MEINGTTYNNDTPMEIVTVLERCRTNRQRIFIEYGDMVTGQGWGDIYDVTGYVGRSTGINKIPLLVHNSRSHGGGGMLDHCIVSIQLAKGKKTLYAHPNYKTGR